LKESKSLESSLLTIEVTGKKNQERNHHRKIASSSSAVTDEALKVGVQVGVFTKGADTSTSVISYKDAQDRPFKPLFEYFPDSIAGIANGRKKSFWQSITRKFAK